MSDPRTTTLCKGAWALGTACGRCPRCTESAYQASGIIRDLLNRQQAAEAPARAVEFGGYLASSADRYMACVNSYASAKEGSDETVEDAEAAMTEAYGRLQSDIYEFRKRSARNEMSQGGTRTAPDWHDRADRTKCQASSQRGDGECWWRYCPAKGGRCPLSQEEYEDA